MGDMGDGRFQKGRWYIRNDDCAVWPRNMEAKGLIPPGDGVKMQTLASARETHELANRDPGPDGMCIEIGWEGTRRVYKKSRSGPTWTQLFANLTQKWLKLGFQGEFGAVGAKE